MIRMLLQPLIPHNLPTCRSALRVAYVSLPVPAAAARLGAAVAQLTWIESQTQPGKRCQEVYFAASLDGGRTFLPGRRISSAPSCPDSAVNGAVYHRWPVGGDYYGMAAAADGRFHLLWADARAGVFQLWTASVEVEGRAVDRN